MIYYGLICVEHGPALSVTDVCVPERLTAVGYCSPVSHKGPYRSTGFGVVAKGNTETRLKLRVALACFADAGLTSKSTIYYYYFFTYIQVRNVIKNFGI